MCHRHKTFALIRCNANARTGVDAEASLARFPMCPGDGMLRLGLDPTCPRPRTPGRRMWRSAELMRRTATAPRAEIEAERPICPRPSTRRFGREGRRRAPDAANRRD